MEKTTITYKDEQIVKKVIDFCLGKFKFIYICGNGGSGKTTLSKNLISEIESRGLEANCINTDEFIVNTDLRKSSKKNWIDADNNNRESKYTSSFRESYYLNGLETIIYSLNKNQNCYFKTKKTNEFIEVKAQAAITIIEGIGAAFLEKDKNAFSIFLTCDINTEIKRRIDRARNGEHMLSYDEVEKECHERNDQFESMVLPERIKFDLDLFSLEDYSLNIRRDDLGLLNKL